MINSENENIKTKKRNKQKFKKFKIKNKKVNIVNLPSVQLEITLLTKITRHTF